MKNGWQWSPWYSTSIYQRNVIALTLSEAVTFPPSAIGLKMLVGSASDAACAQNPDNCPYAWVVDALTGHQPTKTLYVAEPTGSTFLDHSEWAVTGNSTSMSVALTCHHVREHVRPAGAAASWGPDPPYLAPADEDSSCAATVVSFATQANPADGNIRGSVREDSKLCATYEGGAGRASSDQLCKDNYVFYRPTATG